MTPNEIIYQIRLDRELTKLWKELRRDEKEEVLRRLENTNKLKDIKRLIEEVKSKQKWLF